MKLLTKVLIGLATVLVFVAGIGIAVALVLAAPAATSSERPAIVVPVEVVDVQREAVPAVFQVRGVVEAARQVALSPEVAGRVVEIDPKLRPGGQVQAGDLLLRIDARDFVAALEAERARLAQAELELALEEQRQRTSQREWELVGGAPGAESLALRRPHLAVAQANVRSARAAVERAELNVARTRLRAPFAGVITSQAVEVGQVVGSQAAVATLVGTDEVRVIASVPTDRLRVIDIPGVGSDLGARGKVAAGRSVYEGVVTGLVGQLDPQTRTAQIVLSVPSPLRQTRPLLPGEHVTVDLYGRVIPDAIRVPRAAVTEGNVVWLVREGRLARRVVEIGWSDAETVVVTDRLDDGDRVVVSPMALPIEGQPVRAQRFRDPSLVE